MTSKTYELGSDPWLAAMAELLRRHLSDQLAAGETVVLSEEYTNPPGHLLLPGRAKLGWRCAVSGPQVAVSLEPAEDADVFVAWDYSAVLPIARLAYDGGEAEAEIHRLTEAALGAGTLRIQGDPTVLPPRILEAFQRFHNEMSALTSGS